ncbi:MAG TPA: hypothetical protein VFQ76_00965 [Longimicrobiaceae bacterium]|nr:hypothetical protein [Longimicrobiaceae bacterium]
MSPVRGRLTLRALAALLALAVLLTLASSAVRRTRPEVQEWDCPPAPASCAKPVLVLGFPFPYVSDNQGISVVGSASLPGALMGEDFFHPGAFAADVAVYFAAAALVARARTRRRLRS